MINEIKKWNSCHDGYYRPLHSRGRGWVNTSNNKWTGDKQQSTKQASWNSSQAILQKIKWRVCCSLHNFILFYFLKFIFCASLVLYWQLRMQCIFIISYYFLIYRIRRAGSISSNVGVGNGYNYLFYSGCVLVEIYSYEFTLAQKRIFIEFVHCTIAIESKLKWA